MRKIKIEKKQLGSPKRSFLPAKKDKALPSPKGDRFQPASKSANSRKPRNKKKIRMIAFALILLILIAGGVFLYWRWGKLISNSYTADGTKRADACTDIFNPSCWTEAFKPQLDQVDNKTNVLIVGIDTRSEGSGSGLMNTDTIVLATVDHKTKKTRLISFPRDLYAPYGCGDTLPYKTKINAIYAYGKLYCDDKDGMKTLSQTIETITGEKIQYTAIVHLEGVVEVIDSLGGITVNVEKTFVDIYPYIELPSELQQSCRRSGVEPAYCEFKFEAGEQEMDGQTALIYSRMRKYSSDFVRAQRQQQVIEATKNKILADDASTTDKANNLLKVYKNLSGSIETELNLEMILAGLALAKDVDTDPAKVVLDPNFGGGGLIVAGAGSNYNFTDYTFAAVQNKLKIINDNFELYRDDPTIYAVNKTGAAWTSDNPMIELKNSGLWWMEIITDTKVKDATKTGVEIVDYTDGEKQATIDEIKKKFEAKNIPVEVVSSDVLPKSGYKEDIGVYIYDLSPNTTDTAAPTE